MCVTAAGIMPALTGTCSRFTEVFNTLQQPQLKQDQRASSQLVKEQQKQGRPQPLQQHLAQQHLEGVIGVASSLVCITPALILMWPSPILTSKAFAAVLPAAASLAAAVLRYSHTVGTGTQLPSKLAGMHTAAMQAITKFAGVISFAIAITSEPYKDIFKDFMISEDLMLLLATSVAATAVHKCNLPSATTVPATTVSSRASGSSSSTPSRSAAVQSPTHHQQLLQALGLQENQLDCALKYFKIPDSAPVTALQKALGMAARQHSSTSASYVDEARMPADVSKCRGGADRTASSSSSSRSTATNASWSCSDKCASGMPKQLVLPLLLTLAELSALSYPLEDMSELLRTISRCALLLKSGQPGSLDWKQHLLCRLCRR